MPLLRNSYRQTHVRSLTSFLLLCALASIRSAAAQEVPLPLDFPISGVSYADNIPKPEAVIGHVVGTQHTAPHEVVDYFERIAAISDRVSLERHGETYEGRPLIHAIVTSPRNHARLAAIKEANRRLSDSPADVTDAQLGDMPVIVYQGYSVHGNEASGTEASLVYLYHLAAATGASIDAALDNAVLIVDPLFNPDGRDRFVDWVNRNRGGVHTTDGQDLEHNEPWPGGRTNHYYFDLNRDWLPVQLKESQARLALYHDWRPQVLTDHHEMGGNSTFFFQPGIPSRTNPLTPARNQELTAAIGRYHAEQLDAIGSLYYSRESFDDFYYGKGSTFPDINGGIGILFEQASSRALESETQNGPLHYAFTVRNQFAASLSTLKAVTELREDLLKFQRDFYAGASQYARNHRVKAYVIGATGSKGRAQGLLDILMTHRIKVYRLAKDVSSEGKSFSAATDFVVPMNQPQVRLIEAVMEERTTFTDSLFYDVSAWTLPHAFNLEFAAWTSQPGDLIGAEVRPGQQLSTGGVVGVEPAYAYLVPWGEYYLPREVYLLQTNGIRVRMTTARFEAVIDGSARTFAPGTLIIPTQQADATADDVRTAVRQLASNLGITVYATSTGLSPSGPDLGTGTASVLREPKVALIAGSGSSSSGMGEVWHLLSERFRLPVSLLDADRVGRADLSRYTVMINAGGSPDVDAVKAWVRSGGTLVTIGGGTSWAVSNEFIELTRREFDTDSLLEDIPYKDISETRGAQSLGGTIFRTRLDVTHPLAYGYKATLPVFRRGTTFYDPPERAGSRVAVYTADPLVGGYATDLHLKNASGAMAVATVSMGGGRVVAFADDPIFRAFWWGPSSLLLNAVFLSGVY